MILGLVFDHLGRDSEVDGKFADLALMQRVWMHALSQSGGGREKFRDECAPSLPPVRTGRRQQGILSRRKRQFGQATPGTESGSPARNPAMRWLAVEAENETVRILTVFFGVQDYVWQMLARLTESCWDACTTTQQLQEFGRCGGGARRDIGEAGTNFD